MSHVLLLLERTGKASAQPQYITELKTDIKQSVHGGEITWPPKEIMPLSSCMEGTV